MSRVMSFRDLRLVPTLAQYTEVEMLSIGMDDKVNEVLGQMGFNLKAGVLYVPCKHRDMQGNIGVGFRAVGQINSDQEYLKSSVCPMIERLIWAAQKDPSLARELSNMMGHSVNLEDDAIEEDRIEDGYVEEDADIITAQIESLTRLRDAIRGNPYNDHGDLKTPAEYKTKQE